MTRAQQFLFALLFFALPAGVALAGPVYVGSYWVGDGPGYLTNPPCYTPQEAAALLLGGSPSDYWISVDAAVITHTGWEDGWGDTSHLKVDWDGSGGGGAGGAGTPVAENWELQTGTGYNDPYGGPAFSAYVSDHEIFATDPSQRSINYVWSVQGVPEPSTLALLAVGLLGLAGLRRRFSP